jgi:hypothetical protein
VSFPFLRQGVAVFVQASSNSRFFCLYLLSSWYYRCGTLFFFFFFETGSHFVAQAGLKFNNLPTSAS